jgi:hypothetical protein
LEAARKRRGKKSTPEPDTVTNMEDKNSLQDAVGDLIDKRHREERDLLIQVWFNAIIILIRNLRVLCTLNL